MKHCIIKLLVVVAIGMFSLPRLYAQNNLDTTITIYGRNFSPQVIVKLNGNIIPATKVIHNILQPSRILYVTIPLASLKTGTATLIAGTKQNGASLNSNDNINEITVANPGQLGLAAKDTIVVKPKAAQIALLDKINGISIQSPQKLADVAFGNNNLISFVVKYENVDGVLSIDKLIADSTSGHIADLASFDIVDSNGTNPFTTKSLKGSGQLKFVVKFLGQTLGFKRILLALSMSGKTSIAKRNYELNGFCVREFTILAAYTNRSTQLFHVYDTLMRRDPSALLTKAIDTLNGILARTSQITASPDNFLNTRFRLITAPFRVSYQERSPFPHLHVDIDTLAQVTMSRTIAEIFDTMQTNIKAHNADCILMITNHDGKPYRAIASECTSNNIPRFIIADIKYIDMQILERKLRGSTTMKNYQSIRSILYTEAWKTKPSQTMDLNDFFYDNLLLRELRQAINIK
jgi:hypothetical protein